MLEKVEVIRRTNRKADRLTVAMDTILEDLKQLRDRPWRISEVARHQKQLDGNHIMYKILILIHSFLLQLK